MNQMSEQQADVFDFGVTRPPQGRAVAIRFMGPGGLALSRQVVGVDSATDQAAAARWLRRHQFAVASLRVDVLNGLMARYEAELPTVVARRLARRLIAVYRFVLDRTLQQGGPGAIDVSVPHLEAVTGEEGRRTVRIVPERFDANHIAASVRGWVGPLAAGQAAGGAEGVLVRYTLWSWETLHSDAEIEAMLDRGTAPTPEVKALDTDLFRVQSRPVFEEMAAGLLGAIGEGLQLRRAGLADLERMMGLRTESYPGEMFSYREDDGTALDTAPVA
jgi:hypothetical protein